MDTVPEAEEVAPESGVSHQHVVDLCTHRRAPSNEVEKLTSHCLTREQEKSLWLHRALLAPLLTDPDAVINKARKNLSRWSAMHRSDGMTVGYFRKWEQVLNEGLDAVIEVATSPSEEAREMRQNSPFAGVLPDATRVKVLSSFKDHWSREHDRVLVG